MRKTIGASLLTLALSCATYAGHIPNDVKVTPTPEASGVPQETTSSGVQEPQATDDGLTEITLSLLQSVLSLF